MNQQDVVGDRWITVPNIVAVAANSVSNPYRIKWNLNGRVVRVGGCVLGIVQPDTLTNGLTSIGVKCEIDGDRQLFSDGESASYMPLATLFSENRRTESFNYPVRAGSVWVVTFRNFNATVPYTPSFAFSVKTEG